MLFVSLSLSLSLSIMLCVVVSKEPISSLANVRKIVSVDVGVKSFSSSLICFVSSILGTNSLNIADVPLSNKQTWCSGLVMMSSKQADHESTDQPFCQYQPFSHYLSPLFSLSSSFSFLFPFHFPPFLRFWWRDAHASHRRLYCLYSCYLLSHYMAQTHLNVQFELWRHVLSYY